MPRYLRSPEEIIRETGQGIYFIAFADGFEAMLNRRKPAALSDVTIWFHQHQPHIRLEEIGPSEFSSFIGGGFTGELYLDGWRDADIAAYAAVFEDDAGHSIDPRWQVYHYPLAEYERRLSEQPDASCD